MCHAIISQQCSKVFPLAMHDTTAQQLTLASGPWLLLVGFLTDYQQLCISQL
jgi:hypothetical protein